MNFISAYTTIRNTSISKNGKVIHKDSSVTSCEQFLLQAYEALKPEYPKFYKMDQLGKLGFLASEVLLSEYPLRGEGKAENTAVILSNASASLDADIKYMNSTKQIPSPGLFVYTLPNIVAGEISIRHGIKGEHAFFVFDQFQPQFMTAYVDQAMANGAVSCIAGWIEIAAEKHDVFLYLAEKEKRGEGLEHTFENVSKIYNK